MTTYCSSVKSEYSRPSASWRQLKLLLVKERQLDSQTQVAMPTDFLTLWLLLLLFFFDRTYVLKLKVICALNEYIIFIGNTFVHCRSNVFPNRQYMYQCWVQSLLNMFNPFTTIVLIQFQDPFIPPHQKKKYINDWFIVCIIVPLSTLRYF